MKRIVILMATVLLCSGVMAQQPALKKAELRQDTPEKVSKDQSLSEKNADEKAAPETKPADAKHQHHKVRVTPYGFVRNYFTYDNRSTYYVIGGEYNMIPKDENWNMTEAEAAATGLERYDLNAVPTASFLAITTRIGLNLEGPEVWGAKTSGKIEGDFGGFSTTNSVFRIRQAFAKLNWKNEEERTNSELLMGQTWHPLSGDIMPEVLGMAAGAPFRPHSRTPQVRYQFYQGDFGFTVSALYQLQYMNQGPTYDGSKWSRTNSTEYANNAIMPEFFLGVNLKNQHIYAQLGADLQTIRPRTFGTVDNGGVTYKVPVNEKLTCLTPTLYFQYTEGRFALKFRTLLAENTSHLNMLMSGYGVTGMNADGSWEYTALRNSTSYINFAYNIGKRKDIRLDLFFGYMKNLGLTDKGAQLVDQNNDGLADANYVYCKGNYTNINSIYRVAPSVSYNLKHFNVGLEYELTGVNYGDLQLDGTVEGMRDVLGHRVCVLMKYNF